MVIKTDTITLESEKVIDDISNTEVEPKEDKMAELKALMAAKKKEQDMPPRIIEKKKRSLEFGVIGSGQGGSRIAKALNDLGYPAVAINTAMQDLESIDLPESNKLLLEYGIGGAAKDLDIGKNAAEQHRDAIAELISDKLSDSQIYLLCFSLGGGSGSGSHEIIINILSTIQKPIVVITVLPMSTEDAQTKQNALNTLANLAKLAQNNVISNLIIADNAKLETIFSDVNHLDFFTVGNKAIVETLDALNHYSAMSSADKPLDSMEFAKVLIDGQGLSILSEMSVFDYSEDTSIAKSIIEKHDDNLLASGFNLGQAKYVAVVIAANSKVWSQIPRSSIDYAMSIIQENCPGAEGVFRGTYLDENISVDCVKIFSLFSGLGLPESRIEQLRTDVEKEQSRTKQRAQTRNLTLNVKDVGKESISKAQEVRDKIIKGSSKFSQNFGVGGVKDFRKK